ncbi:MAG TPA: serine/threonine phosphatase [Leptolyngbyaceae cyanobacterium M65_K2018_010]|nr:serine/threonine phosphatase [Leptolyngbyaceae cyanobacterium M65_K2018_010]
MLSCPFCKFENVDSAPTCEGCGQPLQRWLSLIWSQPGTHSDGCEAPYLDPGNRYRRIGEALELASPGGVNGKAQLVIDCYPTVDSPLTQLQTFWRQSPHLDAVSHSEIGPLPPVALPYLALQAEHFPSIPELHDVVQTEHQLILVLEDRTNWPCLTSIWSDWNAKPLQQTQWLFEITLLWQALAPWQAQGTLLQPDRLVLSANGLVCLRQIDGPSSQPLTLQSLGQFWRHHLLTPQDGPDSALKEIIIALAEGQPTSVEQLQASLAALAARYQDPEAGEEAGHYPGVECPPAPGQREDQAYLDGDDGPLSLANSPAYFYDTEDRIDSLESPTMVLPMKLLSLEDAGQSHVGRQRRHNEDWFFTQTEISRSNAPSGSTLRARGLYILCDGMGGHASGEVASRLAVTTLQRFFEQHWGDHLPDQDTLLQSIVMANQAIFDANQAKASAGIARMGTTLVLVLVQDLKVAVVHVGDSRLYSYSKRFGLKQLTVDHEVGQREITRGVEPAIAYARPDAYQLTQALGPRSHDSLRPGISYHDIVEDTLLVLCSDGLSDNDLLERHEVSHIAPLLRSQASLRQGVEELIHLANDNNGHDNITAILVRLKLQPDASHLSGYAQS